MLSGDNDEQELGSVIGESSRSQVGSSGLDKSELELRESSKCDFLLDWVKSVHSVCQRTIIVVVPKPANHLGSLLLKLKVAPLRPKGCQGFQSYSLAT